MVESVSVKDDEPENDKQEQDDEPKQAAAVMVEGVQDGRPLTVTDAGSKSIEAGDEAEQVVSLPAKTDTPPGRTSGFSLAPELETPSFKPAAVDPSTPTPVPSSGDEVEQADTPADRTSRFSIDAPEFVPTPFKPAAVDSSTTTPSPSFNRHAGDEAEQAVSLLAKTDTPPGRTSRLSLDAPAFKPSPVKPAAAAADSFTPTPAPSFVPFAGPYYPNPYGPSSPAAFTNLNFGMPAPYAPFDPMTVMMYPPSGMPNANFDGVGVPGGWQQQPTRPSAHQGEPNPSTETSGATGTVLDVQQDARLKRMFGSHRQPQSSINREMDPRDSRSRLGLESHLEFPPLRSSTSTSAATVSSSSSPGVRGYSAALDGKIDAKEQEWATKMLNRLREDFSEEVSSFEVRVSIEFNKLLWKDRELALEICNAKGTSDKWIQEATKELFKDNELLSKFTGRIDFKGLPSSLKSALSVIASKTRSKKRSICRGKLEVYESTEHGKRVAEAILRGILLHICLGMSWEGTLTIDDLFIEEESDGTMTLYIAKEPKILKDAKLSDKLKDLANIWNLVEPHYLLDGNLPLYFPRLKCDLLTATELSQWFVEYLLHHPAFYSSAPRKNFVTAIQKTCKARNLANDSNYKMILILPLSEDWRRVAYDSGILRSLLDFETEDTKKKKQQGRGPDTPPEIWKGKAGYRNTMISHLDLYRNGLEHLDQHVKVDDMDEMELALASVFPDLLPDIMYRLLSVNKMDELVQEAWRLYQHLKFV